MSRKIRKVTLLKEIEFPGTQLIEPEIEGKYDEGMRDWQLYHRVSGMYNVYSLEEILDNPEKFIIEYEEDSE